MAFLPRIYSDETCCRVFVWHLRAFFWELWSAIDIVQRAAKTTASAKAVVEASRNERWFKEIQEYRNFAHQSFLSISVIMDDRRTGLDFYLPDPKGQANKLHGPASKILPEYLRMIGELITITFI